MEGSYVAYYRVSTKRQGRSGLGLEAQKQSVMNYLDGGNWDLLEEFVEVETGKGKNALEQRPELKRAIAHAKRMKAKLIIAKLDRLARNVHFITSLMESRVPFVCADMPEANELTLHVMAAMAQYEAKMISSRTKEALAKAKERGVKLGKVENLQTGNRLRFQTAQEFAERLRPQLDDFKALGMSQRAMVDRLNALGVKTSAGCEWKLMTLQRVLKRVGL